HVDLHVSPAANELEVSDLPRATRYARYQAEQGSAATNLWHESVRLNDLERHLLRRLDGRTDHAELTQSLTSEVEQGQLIVQDGGRALTDLGRVEKIISGAMMESLGLLARKGFLLKAQS
ncbi:MAG TPA: hypothetical protein VFV87_20780, partial [Pirellulaceae bacterium]|nr:hypothetical protein [Pirellulaceae bacterium]